MPSKIRSSHFLYYLVLYRNYLRVYFPYKNECFKSLFFLISCALVFACTYICVRVLNLLELDLQRIVNCHVVAGN